MLDLEGTNSLREIVSLARNRSNSRYDTNEGDVGKDRSEEIVVCVRVVLLSFTFEVNFQQEVESEDLVFDRRRLPRSLLDVLVGFVWSS